MTSLLKTRPHWKGGINIFVLFIGILALIDQIPADSDKSGNLSASSRFLAERKFVQTIENSLPAGSMVYQYPYSQYLSDNKYYGWGAFAHMRAYLHSSNLHWSNGGSKNSPVDNWHMGLTDKTLDDILPVLQASGFRGVLFDLWVLKPDEFSELRKLLEGKYNLSFIVDDSAKMAFSYIESPGYTIEYSNEMRPHQLVIQDVRKINFELLPNNISRLKLAEAINSSSDVDNLSINLKEHDGVVLEDTFIGAFFETRLEKADLLGELDCSVSFNSENQPQIRIAVKNHSNKTWKLNVGKYPLSIGYHILDSQKSVLQWDNGFRVKDEAWVPENETRFLLVDLNELPDKETWPHNGYVAFELVQDGNMWFNANPKSADCQLALEEL
ncbi:hypothetical protein KOI40_17670 [Aestuariicella sp. G3-2]|uniref:hypothetical protein n=1 Tax=Pseudomaricurvus albidus TaxID=2842452 RepID=UPI001C0C89B0|nr:hypothetical protein [Aestuariicella albida]MBU3071661.1 hypothetical protein [Aestuariicella albida]